MFIPLENKQDSKTEIQIQNRFDPVAHVLFTFSYQKQKEKIQKTKVVKNGVSQFPLKCLNHTFCDFCPLFITHQQVCKSVRVGLNLNKLHKKKKKCYDQSTYKF